MKMKQQEKLSGDMFPQGQLIWKEINHKMSRPMDGETFSPHDLYDSRRMRKYCMKINRAQFKTIFRERNFSEELLDYILEKKLYAFKDFGDWRAHD